MSVKIISIQSSVLNGIVGNSAAKLVFDRFGVQGIYIPTIILSNHRGEKSSIEYTHTRKLINSYNSLKSVYQISKKDPLLIGYCPSSKIINEIKTLSCHHNKVFLDPVIGDSDTGLYLSQDVVSHLPKLVNQANFISLNFFEFNILFKQETHDNLKKIIQNIITISQKLKKNLFVRSIIHKTKLYNVISDPRSTFVIETPNIQFASRVNGAGDITTALFVLEQLKFPKNPKKILENTTNKIFYLIKNNKARNFNYQTSNLISKMKNEINYRAKKIDGF